MRNIALPTPRYDFLVHRVALLVRTGTPWPKALTWTIHEARSPFMGDAAMIELSRQLERDARAIMRQRQPAIRPAPRIRADALLARLRDIADGADDWPAIGVPEDTQAGDRAWRRRAREAFAGRGSGGASQRAKPVPRAEPVVVNTRILTRAEHRELAPLPPVDPTPMPALAELPMPVSAPRVAGLDALALTLNARRL